MRFARVLGRLAATLIVALAFAGYAARAEAHGGHHSRSVQIPDDATASTAPLHAAVPEAVMAASTWPSGHCDDACGHCCPATSIGATCSMACAGAAGVLSPAGVWSPTAAADQIAQAGIVAAGLAPSPDPHPPKALSCL